MLLTRCTLKTQLWLALATAGFAGGCATSAWSAYLGAAVAPALAAARHPSQIVSNLVGLGMVEPLVVAGGAVEHALQAVAEAAAAARKSASAASAAADRIAALERTVEQVRAEAHSNRAEAEQLRDQLAHAESPASIWMLGAAAAALALLAGWLALRLSAARHAQDAAWKRATPAGRQALIAAELAERQPTAVMAFVHSDLDTAPIGPARTRPAPAWPPPAPPDGWEPPASAEEKLLRPQPLPTVATATPPRSMAKAPPDAATLAPHPPPAPTWREPTTSAQISAVALADPPLHLREEGQAPRDVSIDELLDLEQQAEFFIVLGQDDAAIELLIDHLRHTGGSSPLPYLKLLEIHRRRGDRSDYERMRARFNQRFNAYAPEWEVDLQSGRSLDDYAGILTRLQQLWTRPLDSMAELESMMFRKLRGELFDLPAYREVMFLYALARDLHEREAADCGSVDLLLPLSEGGEFSSTAPTPFRTLGNDAPRRDGGFDPRPAGPVDLDLSLDSGRPSSIFDPLEETPTHPRIR